MRDRREQVLKIICLMLGALLAFELARFVVRGDPAKSLVVPAIPSLPPEPEAQSGKATNSATAKGPGQKGTNSIAAEASAKKETNSVANKGGTNSLPEKQLSGNENNSVKVAAEQNKGIGSNAAPIVEGTTNSNPEQPSGSKPSNSPPVLASTNNVSNALAKAAGPKEGTNSAASKASAKKNSPGGAPPNLARKGPELPPEIKERVDRIVQGEILGQVMRPMPMALLGIAGQNAFLRSPEGQTGMVKEGDQLGTIKLLRIGTNRVLIEHEGEKKELTIFAGLGSETMLPKNEKKPNETTNKPLKEIKGSVTPSGS